MIVNVRNNGGQAEALYLRNNERKKIMKTMLGKKEKSRKMLSLITIIDIFFIIHTFFQMGPVFSPDWWLAVKVILLFSLITLLEYLSRTFFLFREIIRCSYGFLFLYIGIYKVSMIAFLVLSSPLLLYLLPVSKYAEETETQTLYGQGEY